MIERPYFIFNGIDSRDYGLIITDVDNRRVAKRRVKSVSIPGRSGNLHIDDGSYENIPIRYKVALAGEFAQTYSNFVNAVMAGAEYLRLTDSICPDIYLLAAFTGPIEPDVAALERWGSFWITFDCAPQRFLVSGDSPITVSRTKTISNAWQPSHPIITIDCTGASSVTVNGKRIQFAESGHYVINTDIPDIYDDSSGAVVNRNHQVSLPDGWPVLQHGDNVISASGNYRNLRIVPRWWHL